MKVLKFLNDNHWFIIAGMLTIAILLWTYGCESTVQSMLDDNKKVNRTMLTAELNYIIADIENRVADLDKQDEIKQALLDAANVIGTTGSINPSGLLNIAATIGAISFGLNRNQKLKKEKKKSPTEAV